MWAPATASGACSTSRPALARPSPLTPASTCAGGCTYSRAAPSHRRALLAAAASSSAASAPPAAAAASPCCQPAQRHQPPAHRRSRRGRTPAPQRSSGLADRTATAAAAAGGGGGGGGGGAPPPFGDPNSLIGMLMAYAVQQQQQQGGGGRPPGAEVVVEGLGFHPPGAERPLLADIRMALPPNSLGLVMGRSGSGKTTLLQVLAGLTEQTEGRVRILQGGAGSGTAAAAAANGNGMAAANGNGLYGGGVYEKVASAPLPGLSVEERMQQVGLVFQFPERHFLGEDLLQELTFTWPRLPQYWAERQALSGRMQQVLEAVGLQDTPMHVPPWALSGGQQRRLALALQLVRAPALLLLDEPLAGLDWVARQEVVAILRRLKEQCTLLVVSHDLGEIAPLVDCAWRMREGGTCEAVAWPPADLAGLEQ